MRSRPKPKRYDLEAAGRFFSATVHRKARCAVCGGRAEEAHHVLVKTWLEKVAKSLRLSNDERNALIWDPRNGMPLSHRCHEKHTNAVERVPRSALSPANWEFVAYVNALTGTEEASVRIEREYPEP